MEAIRDLASFSQGQMGRLAGFLARICALFSVLRFTMMLRDMFKKALALLCSHCWHGWKLTRTETLVNARGPSTLRDRDLLCQVFRRSDCGKALSMNGLRGVCLPMVSLSLLARTVRGFRGRS